MLGGAYVECWVGLGNVHFVKTLLFAGLCFILRTYLHLYVFVKTGFMHIRRSISISLPSVISLISRAYIHEACGAYDT